MQLRTRQAQGALRRVDSPSVDSILFCSIPPTFHPSATASPPPHLPHPPARLNAVTPRALPAAPHHHIPPDLPIHRCHPSTSRTTAKARRPPVAQSTNPPAHLQSSQSPKPHPPMSIHRSTHPPPIHPQRELPRQALQPGSLPPLQV